MSKHKIKYAVDYELSHTTETKIDPNRLPDFIRHQLQHRVCEAIVNKMQVSKRASSFACLSDIFSIHFYLATEEEFWQCVREEAKKLNMKTETT